MKKLCFVVFLYGVKYQWYIPLYVYSINQAYPEYDVRIYIREKLTEDVSSVLSELSFLKNYVVIDNIENDHRYSFPSFPETSPKHDLVERSIRSFRWLLYDEAFEQYHALYIGDIDIFIAKDKLDIYEQHLKHCEFLGVPYSNITRKWEKMRAWFPRRMCGDIRRYGFPEVFREVLNPRSHILRISGLHFVIVRDYFEKVRPLIDDYKRELELIAEKRSKKWNKCLFDDEAVLYDLISDANFAIPEPVNFAGTGTSPSILPDVVPTNNYRPHHGLHLGIWRGRGAEKKYPAVVKSDVYREYYRQFCELRDIDINFRLLLEKESDFIKNIISNMDESMGKLL